MALASGVKIAPIHITATHSSTGGTGSSRMKGRDRKNSIVKVEEIDETQEQVLDQSVYNNMNVEWVNRKGVFRSLTSDSTVAYIVNRKALG